jgi:hypothetical protein
MPGGFYQSLSIQANARDKPTNVTTKLPGLVMAIIWGTFSLIQYAKVTEEAKQPRPGRQSANSFAYPVVSDDSSFLSSAHTVRSASESASVLAAGPTFTWWLHTTDMAKDCPPYLTHGCSMH